MPPNQNERVPRVMAIAASLRDRPAASIGALDAALEYICSHPGMWRATSRDIVQHFLAQQLGRTATALL
jgi:allantoinase